MSDEGTVAMATSMRMAVSMFVAVGMSTAMAAAVGVGMPCAALGGGNARIGLKLLHAAGMQTSRVLAGRLKTGVG